MTPDKTEHSVLIGASGHRDLRPEDLIRIHQELLKKIRELKTHCTVLTLVTGTAEGTDAMIVEIASNESIPFLDLNSIVPGTAGETNEDYYARQATYLVENCDHIIAVWDGIYTHKPGGTSEVVRMALYGERSVTIHHLVAPRISNPFPVASLLEEVIDYKRKKFLRIPFAIHFSWIVLKNSANKEKTKAVRGASSKDGEFTWNYLIQLIAILITLIVGFIGFWQQDGYKNDFINYFFRTIKLFTLDFPGATNWLLFIAYFSGLASVSIAFIYAFRVAFKPQYESYKRRRWKKAGFNLVTGLNEMSFDLIADLARQKEKVVVLCSADNEALSPELEKMRHVITVKGNPSSATMLRELYFDSAKKIFIMSRSDTQNVRTMQELDILTQPGSTPDAPDRFVHVQDENLRKFLKSSLGKHSVNRSNIFSIYENTVRKLLLLYPVDRFHQTPGSFDTAVFIIGFSELGKQLAIALLKQGHYEQDKHLHITVICANAADEEKNFNKVNPMFPEQAEDSTPLKNMKKYVWKNIHVQFLELPAHNSGWAADDFPLYHSMVSSNIVTVYACLPNGIESASMLHTTLPALDILKQQNNCNLQVFCYYNFPDKKEEQVIEDHLNKLAPHTFVKCFGNFKDECSASAIQNMALDALPQLIHAKYSNPWIFEVQEQVETHWYQASEKDKSSSRQAGDHLWTKLRILGPLIEWQFDPSSFEPNETMKEKLYDLELISMVGEIEHRRWCAEMLIQGFVPPKEAPGSSEYLALAERWTDKAFKQATLNLGTHINLVPYDKLLNREAAKDTDQIKTIPVFLQRIIHR